MSPCSFRGRRRGALPGTPGSDDTRLTLALPADDDAEVHGLVAPEEPDTVSSLGSSATPAGSDQRERAGLAPRPRDGCASLPDGPGAG